MSDGRKGTVDMHRIVKAHLDSFVKSWALEAECEANQFESSLIMR